MTELVHEISILVLDLLDLVFKLLLTVFKAIKLLQLNPIVRCHLFILPFQVSLFNFQFLDLQLQPFKVIRVDIALIMLLNSYSVMWRQL